MRFPAALAVLALIVPFGADAQEAIATASAEDPPAAVTGGGEDALGEGRSGGEGRGAEDPGDWARRVLAGKPAPPERPQAMGAPDGCPLATDGKPHGQVWAGIGTRGYREVGGVVTQQVGRCGSVTIAVSKTEGPTPRMRPRR